VGQCGTEHELLAVESMQFQKPAIFRTGSMTSFFGSGYELGSLPDDHDFEG